ncbi:MAG: NrdH-redoxin [Candidatus Sungbacteria bacterium RIFCSPHIGHO2_02_FULL_49_12]|uniref:NrdH-redoxin n=1 Tax=Candidatus Sungbacteria bacterium RIFCSPHIGHO2_02_FULL_49_12 TaxID=1802271 RepID=A0A1G2KNR7_9BACT|nr:MAG: NrdH-redoxin [Candidatus Sungbacteria bacterium RIFCSPHIGHO2_02_FULL_49_12]
MPEVKIPKVKIYSTPPCVYCKMAKAFFKENNIEFQEVDVASDSKAREEMIKKSGQIGVPVIDVGGKVIVGFDKPRLSQALGIN